MGDGFQAQGYSDSQNMFTLGRAAIYPAGSWEISGFRAQAKFDMGAFLPPVPKAGDKCYISDQADHALGLNPKSKNPEAAKAFLEWLATPEFAELYSNCAARLLPALQWRDYAKGPAGPGLPELAQGLRVDHPPVLPDPVARHAEPRKRTWVESANVINGTDTPQEAGDKLQAGLASWYRPQKGK